MHLNVCCDMDDSMMDLWMECLFVQSFTFKTDCYTLNEREEKRQQRERRKRKAVVVNSPCPCGAWCSLLVLLGVSSDV